jgi:anti-anti-sigma factor
VSIGNTFSIKSSKKGSVLIFAIEGRIDALTQPSVEKTIFEFISNGETNILIDFRNVSYLSSCGMRMLLSVAKKLKGLSGKLVISQVNESSMDVLKLSGCNHTFEITPTQDEGLKRF